MNITEIESSRDTLHVKITIPSGEIDSDVTKLMTKLAKNVKINGFRAGKVPNFLIERIHNKSLRGDAVRDKVLEVTSLLIKERNLRILIEPIVEYIRDEEEQDLEFTIRYYLWPEIAISNLENISLEKPVLKLDQNDVDNLVKNLIDYPKEEGNVGDQITIDAVKKHLETRKVSESLKRGEEDQIKDINYDDLLPQLREEATKDIYRAYEDPIKAVMKMALFKELDSMLKFNIPSILLDKEKKILTKEIAREKDEELKVKFLENESYLTKLAFRRIKIRLILTEYARIHRLEISQEDIKNAVINQVKNFPGKEKKIYNFYLKNPRALEALRGKLLEDKVLTIILEKTVTVTEKFYTKDKLEELVAKSVDSL